VSDAKRLKALEDENAKLKKLLAEAALDNAMPKDVASFTVARPRQTIAVRVLTQKQNAAAALQVYLKLALLPSGLHLMASMASSSAT
jgi:hypothetical protein